MGNMLVPFKKFLSNKNTVTILGVLLGIVVLYFGYSWRVNRSVAPTYVPVAAEKLLSGTKITENHITRNQVPKSFISNMTNIVVAENQIIGKVVAINSTIAPNSFFFSDNLTTEEDMPDSIFSNIPDGYTIFNLGVSYESTYANAIKDDDSIDLYMRMENEDDGKLIYGCLLKSIKVLAVRDKNGQDVFRDSDNPTEPAYLLFAVPENLFLLLKKATYLGISIEPVPRNSSYSKNPAATELSSDELKQKIINQTYILQGQNDE